jgi:hypothetical protein
MAAAVTARLDGQCRMVQRAAVGDRRGSIIDA